MPSRTGGATYVFVLSRKYPGNHDGVDFGTGFTPVTIHLPFATAPAAIQLYKLAHADGSAADPNENNLAAPNVVIHGSTIPTTAWNQDFPINASTGGTAAGMPPGTVFLYVFQH